jgi:PTS system ascorbate-specific IIA component
MAVPPLPDSAVLLRRPAADWREAVALAGSGLEQAGCTTADYTARMIGVVEQFGAYIVIAPGLALAHARPGPDVLKDGVSVVTLADPIAFGHPHNDPVRVIVGLAVDAPDSHVAGVAALANVFNDPAAVNRIWQADTVRDVQEILAAGEAVSR